MLLMILFVALIKTIKTVHFLHELVIVKCENEFFNFHKVVQRQFLGKAAKLLFAREQIMSGFCVPKITKFGKFFIMLFTK